MRKRGTTLIFNPEISGTFVLICITSAQLERYEGEGDYHKEGGQTVFVGKL